MTDETKPARREQRLSVPVAEYTAGLTNCRGCRATVVRWLYPKTGNWQTLEVSTAKRSAIGGPAAPYLLESHFAYCPVKRRARRAPAAVRNERQRREEQRDPWLNK